MGSGWDVNQSSHSLPVCQQGNGDSAAGVLVPQRPILVGRGGTASPAPSPWVLASAGWAILPVEPRGKRPLVKWSRYEEEQPSPDQVLDWAEKFPGCNWAVVLGPASEGLIAIDIDAQEAQAWCDNQGGFVRTPTAWHTTGRGWRYLYKVPDDLADLGVVEPSPKVEFRVSGCLCTIPPSVHETGVPYLWRLPPNPGGKTAWRQIGENWVPKAIWPIPTAPQWVLDLLSAHAGRRVVVPSRQRDKATSLPLSVLLSRDPLLAEHIMTVAGRGAVPIGKDFRCILHGHNERHPSASWRIAEDGRVLYRDWHGRGDHEWYGLAEVWHSITTSEAPRHLNPYEAARALEALAHDAGRLNLHTEGLLQRARGALQDLWGKPETTGEHICDYVVSDDGVGRTVWRVWREAEAMFLSRAREGHASILASARYVSGLTGLSIPQSNRSCNLLCVLGLMRKVGTGKRGDAFELCLVEKEEVRRRWDVLGHPSLDQLNRELVVERLCPEVATAVFRRGGAG
ncbi:MAG: bifunctional DNA primase/polymerase [Candidatus Bipolaricaulis sp.]|nr:bifunctional DNA primase/polymerase [Candidatus Bipolaricaulis sp.]